MDSIPQAPWWLETFRIAQAMNIPPWKLTGGTHTLWYARAQAIRNAEIQRSNRQRQRAAAAEQQAEQMTRQPRGRR